jgi:hypothetical protein
VSKKFDLKNALENGAKAASRAADSARENAADALASVASETARADLGEFVASAGTAAKGALATVEKSAADVTNSATSALSYAANEAAKIDPSELAATAVDAAATAAKDALATVEKSAADAANSATEAISSGLNIVKAAMPAQRVRRSRISGFYDGIKQGAYLATEQRYNFYRAYVAVMCYMLRCDGEFSQEEKGWLEEGLRHLKLEGGLPDRVKGELLTIANDENMSFDEVKGYLDNVNLKSLESMAGPVEEAAEADGEASEDENEAYGLYKNYVSARMACVAVDDGWAKRAVEKSVREYGENLDRANRQFREKTALQDADIAFLMGATALQVSRVLIINSLTTIEKAGQGNAKEKALHDFQGDVFKGFDHSGPASSRLYASREHILTSRGVPYDATRYEDKNYKLFKGANHRFATLGHDPLLGLVFGTSNIMTNSITCVENVNLFGVGARIPVTHQVDYDALGKHPAIAGQVATTEMLVAAGKRVVQEPDAAAAALIKQLIHIGTDAYTPRGIQIPFANLVLDKAGAEKLTSYVSTGDLLKVGVQAGMTVLINWLIASLHGCSLIFNDDGSDFSTELYQARTKKILLLSDTIATSSSVVQAAITNNPKCLDLGGAAVLVRELFSDVRFTGKLKEEYVNSELSKIYDERAAGLL